MRLLPLSFGIKGVHRLENRPTFVNYMFFRISDDRQSSEIPIYYMIVAILQNSLAFVTSFKLSIREFFSFIKFVAGDA
jgi:hypothetical protein